MPIRNCCLGLTLAASLLAARAAPAQGVPDSIIAQDVPPIPPTLAEELNRYQNIRLANFQDWAPDGRQILILTRFGDTNQVHRVEMPLGARNQLTFFRERVAGARSRPGQNQFLFSMDEGGAENFQLYLFDLPSGKSERLTDGRSRNVSPRCSHSGKLLAWSSNVRNGKDMDLYVMNPSDPRSAQRVKEVTGDWTVADWSPDDRRLAAIEVISANETHVHVIDLKSGQTETVTPRPAPGNETAAYRNVRWSKDGQSLYWTSDEGSEFHRLALYSLRTKKARALTAGIPWDVETFDLSEDGRTIAFVTNEDGLSKVRVLDAATGRERPGPKLPAGEIFGVSFRRNSQEFAYSMSSAHTPSDVYSYDLVSRKLTRWTRSETAGLETTFFSEPALVHYPSFDRQQIPAFLYRPGPRFRAPYPVLISIHGGPEAQWRPGFLGRTHYLLNELGIAILFPNVRGSSGYGKSYLKLDNGTLREDAVRDIGALLDWIKTQPELDASRVAVAGGSYGGYMTLATMTRYSDRLRAGMDSVGISNFLTFLKNTQDYRRDLRRVEYGNERDPEMNAFLQKISPLTNAGKITRPLLVAAGKNDPRVPVTESEQIVAEVRKNGVPVWYVLGKNEGHGFQRKVNQDYLQYVQALFLKTYLLGEKNAP